MKPVNNKYLDKKNNDLIEEKNEPIDTKEYVLSKLNIFNDVGFYKKELDIIGNGKVTIKSYYIKSLNNHQLLYPWHILYDFSKFIVKKVNNEYGRYLLINGDFSYGLEFNRYGGRIIHGFFDINYEGNSKCILFRKGEFNEELFRKKNRNIIFSQDIDDCKYIMTGDLYSLF